MEGELFAVDKWGCKKSKVFFLTHMHTDHTKGLSQQWRRGPIYCSAITAALLRLKFPALDIHILPLSTPTLITLPSPHILEVTAIDADHCPGSVMFVLRGAFGCILHTGDFRWESGSPRLDSMKQCLATAIGGSRVTLVHLDNTFCSPHISFPTRQIAAQQVVDIVVKHEGSDVLIGIDNLGKEELLIFIAKALKMKIWVWPERLQTMTILGIAEFFTTDTTATRIRAVPRYSISHETLKMLNEIRPTVAVLPSGLNYPCKPSVSGSGRIGTHNSHAVSKRGGMGSHYQQMLRTEGTMVEVEVEEGKECSTVQESARRDIYLVPYSLHSCFAELKEFLDFIKPLSVKGNLRSFSVDINPLLQMHGRRVKDSKHFARAGETKSAKILPEIDRNIYSRHASSDDVHIFRSSNNGRHEKEQDVHIVNYDAAYSKRHTFCRSMRARATLRKASCKRAQQAWAALLKRRGGGTNLYTEP